MSAEVLQLQQDLLSLHIDPGPIDGLMGSKTRGAAHTAAQRLGLTDFTGGDIPASLIAKIHDEAEATRAPIVRPARYLDLSDVSAPGWREGYRPLSEVVGVTLHQTGCPMPEVTPDEVAWFESHQALGGGNTLALNRWVRHNIGQSGAPQYVSLKTHLGITYGGQILQVHPFDLWGWSAQSFSRTTISIEIAGFFEGIDGDPKTRPGGPASWKTQRATEAQIEAAKELIRYLYRYFQARGKGLKFVRAHRQATNDRTPDPGERVWKGVALPIMAELGLTDGGPGFVKGKGQPIPGAWNPAYKDTPY